MGYSGRTLGLIAQQRLYHTSHRLEHIYTISGALYIPSSVPSVTKFN
jgi:hypothetical protein